MLEYKDDVLFWKHSSDDVDDYVGGQDLADLRRERAKTLCTREGMTMYARQSCPMLRQLDTNK